MAPTAANPAAPIRSIHTKFGWFPSDRGSPLPDSLAAGPNSPVLGERDSIFCEVLAAVDSSLSPEELSPVLSSVAFLLTTII